MAQIHVFGRVMHDLVPKKARQNNRMSALTLWSETAVTSRTLSGMGRGDAVARLMKLKVRKGSMIWLTGSQKLVDVRQKDGSTVKKLKVWLTDFGYLPGQTSRAKPECDQNGSDQAETVPAPAEVMDGDREPLPG
ncbi:MAG: single-stranded DNA-binding protein [Eubacteriales bacterium]